MHRRTMLRGLVAAGLALGSGAAQAQEQSPEDFYKGKTLTWIVSTGPGGGHDFYARLIVKHMAKFMPDTTIIVKNVPGAGHIIGANTVYLSKPDGLTVGSFSTGLVYAHPGIWQETVQTNVVGTFFITRAVTPHLIAQNWGRIITITTSNSGMGGARGSPYGLTKMALEAATRIWAADLAGTGVTVNSLLPGGSCANEPGKITRSGKPLLPMDIMNPLLLWLASDLSDGVTGDRFVGKLWDTSLPPNHAAAQAMERAALL